MTTFMTYKEERDVLCQQLAEKDAEIERLKTVPIKYRRMAFNAQLQAENNALEKQLAVSQAREVQLREALTCCVCAMQDYQAGIGITEMFDKGERLGRLALQSITQD